MTHDWTQPLDQIVAETTEEIVSLRRHLHAHPEPSGQELETSLALYQRLDKAGFNVRMGPDGCGIVADNQAPSGSHRVAMRGDIDALLIHDEKLVAYRSTVDGVMHACGHDAHAAIVYGAAICLAAMERQSALPWPLAWRAIFQPSEETATGARIMIESGALENVRSIFALHVDPTRPTGEIGVLAGPFTAHCDAVRFVVHGEGGHGARPHESKDPIAAAAQLISTLYQFVPRATDTQDAVVLTIGCLRGGQNPNVIPEHTELGGTLRTLNAQVRLQTIEHIHRLAQGVGDITGTHIEVMFEASIPSVYNDQQATRLVVDVAERNGNYPIRKIPRPSMGSEDFACYLEQSPGAMFRLGVAGDLSAITPLHTPRFDIDEQALPIGVRMLAGLLIAACEPDAAAASTSTD